MRFTNIHGFAIEYPDDIIWVNDNNYISIRNDNAARITAEATITHPTGYFRKIGYASPTNGLVLDLNMLLGNMFDDNISNYGCSLRLFANNILIHTFEFTFKVYFGKSYTNKSHGIENTIYIYDFEQLKKVEIFAVDNCFGYVGNQVFTLRRGINSLNLYPYVHDYGTTELCLSAESIEPQTTIVNVEPGAYGAVVNLSFETGEPISSIHKGGDVWTPDATILPVCHKIEIIKNCHDTDVFELIYTNSDGCIRHLAGNIIEETNTAKQDVYKITNGEFANISRGYAYSNERKVKVGFQDIAKDAYISDILLSQRLEYMNYAGEFYPCRLLTDKIVVTSEDSSDYTLEFIISE